MEYVTSGMLWCYLTILFLINILYRGCIAQLTTTIEDQIAVVGTTIKLNCSVESIEKATLSWEIDWSTGESTRFVCGNSSDTELTRSSNGQYISTFTTTDEAHQCVLTITKLTQDDAGSYSCTLTPPGNGTVSEQEVISEVVSNFELSVVQCLASPLIPEMIVSIMTIRNGIDFEFICNVSGNSRNQITWVNASDSIISTSQDDGVFQNTLKLKDNGKSFTCHVKPSDSSTNTGDASYCQVTPIRLFPILTMRTTIIVMEGANITIPCTVEIGAQFITGYSWIYNNKSISVDDTNFKVETEEDMSSSTLTILNVSEDFNYTLFTCEVHTVDGLRFVESTRLSVIETVVDGNATVNQESVPLTWPIAVGVSLALMCFLVFVLVGAVLKRYRQTDADDTEKSNMQMMQINGSATNGHINPVESNMDTFDDDIFAHRGPPLDFLDATGRRKSSLFRESFQDLWRGNNMDLDNISNCSSVSLPSFAAVSRSRPDLTADHSEEFQQAAVNTHTPLSARVSAPASFTFNENKTSQDGSELTKNTIPENVVERKDSDNIEADVDTVPDMAETDKVKPKAIAGRVSQVSISSNMSIPSVTITAPDL